MQKKTLELQMTCQPALQFYFRPHYCSVLQASCQTELVHSIYPNPQCLFKVFMLEASEFVQIQNNTHSQAKEVVEKKIQRWRMFQRNLVNTFFFFFWQSLKSLHF